MQPKVLQQQAVLFFSGVGHLHVPPVGNQINGARAVQCFATEIQFQLQKQFGQFCPTAAVPTVAAVATEQSLRDSEVQLSLANGALNDSGEGRGGAREGVWKGRGGGREGVREGGRLCSH